jgi:hypothetical protein
MRAHRLIPLTLFAALAALPFAAAQTLTPGSSVDASVAEAPHAARASSLRAHGAVRAHGDARVCLEHDTNLEVIACAEKYRPQRRKS